jgi:protein-tyrosine-phosphatase
MRRPLHIVTLCTGNASRSVMLGFMLETLSSSRSITWDIRTAGTHAVEGQAMSQRTLEALQRIEELRDHHFARHRSHQITAEDVAFADVILTSEADHVAFCHARFPASRGRAVQVASFCRWAPLDESLSTQLDVVVAHGENDELDVADPAGGDQVTYDRCADDLWDLAQVFATIVSDDDLDEH